MNKVNAKNIVKNIKSTMKKHSPEILTGIGIAGMITTTVLAVRATPKAIRIIEAIEREEGRELTAGEKVKACWKCYVPPVITATTSVACLIGASSAHTKRNAALATAYKLSEAALVEYKDKVIETIGEKKEREIRDKIAEDRITNNPVSKNDVIVTGNGTTLFYEHLSGRYFESDVDKIKKAEYEINRAMLVDGYASLNDLYDELGLEHTRIGYELGWKIDDGRVDIEFSARLAENDKPCLAIDYSEPPKYDYASYM